MDKSFNLKHFNKKAAQDFTSNDVRRLNGILLDFRYQSSKALEEMEKWLENGEQDISFKQAQDRLRYYLGQMGLL
jgi:DNA topoisomerase VI subunit A